MEQDAPLFGWVPCFRIPGTGEVRLAPGTGEVRLAPGTGEVRLAPLKEAT